MVLTEVRGEAPPLVGEVCEELVCQALWSDGCVEDPANLIHLRFGGRWFRLFFDWGEIIWNPGSGEPRPREDPNCGATYPLFDLAAHCRLKGRRVESLWTQPVDGGLLMTLEFDDGRRLAFRNIDSVTSWSLPR